MSFTGFSLRQGATDFTGFLSPVYKADLLSSINCMWFSNYVFAANTGFFLISSIRCSCIFIHRKLHSLKMGKLILWDTSRILEFILHFQYWKSLLNWKVCHSFCLQDTSVWSWLNLLNFLDRVLLWEGKIAGRLIKIYSHNGREWNFYWLFVIMISIESLKNILFQNTDKNFYR